MRLIRPILKFFTATRRRKFLSVVLVLAVLLVSFRFFFFPAKEVQAADVYLTMDEGYGTSSAVHDTNSSISAGSITNAVWKTEDLCKTGKCLYFDGTGDYVSFGDDDDLDMAAANTVTVELWFRTPDITSGTRTLISKEEATGADGGYRIQMNSSGQIVFGIDDNNTGFPLYGITTSSSYDDNKWHYIAAVKDGTSTMTLYLDGQSAGTISIASTAADNDDAFYIGIYNAASDGFSGFIDEVKVLRTARTATEIKADFTGETPSRGTSASFGPDNSFLSNGLVGYWKMDEKVADLCTGAFNDVCDSSGNGIDGAHEGTMSASGVNQTKKYGESLHFDNTDDRTNFGDANHLDFGDTDDFTISIWFNRDTFISDDTILAKSNAQSGSQGFIVWIDDANDDVNFAVTDGSSNSYSMNGITATTATGWHNIIIVYDQDSDVNSTIYFDGKVDKQSSTGTITSVGSLGNALDFMLGTESDLGNPYSGELDETRIYKRVLTPVEAVAVYNWAPGPVGYWSFDDNTGSGSGVVKDRSGNSNNGTTNGGMTSSNWTPGKFGSAMTFDGSDDYVSITDPGTASILDVSAQSGLTLEAWIKPTVLPSSSACYTILTKGAVDATDDVDYQILICEDGAGGYELDFYSNGAWRFTSATLQAKVWQHVAIKIGFGYENTYFYLNGVQIGTAGGHVPVTQNKAIWIGAQNSVGGAAVDSPFNGAIDEVKIYDYERTAGQIVEDMNAGHPAPGSPVGSSTLWWNFDEGADNTCADGADDACNSGSGGTALDGANTAISWTNNGKFGKAVEMYQDGDTISAGDVSFLDGISQMTVSMWIYPDNVADGFDFIGKTNQSTQNSFLVRGDAGNIGEIRIYIATAITEEVTFAATTSLDLSSDVWQHLVIVYDGTLSALDRVKVYKNAAPVLVTGDSGTPSTLTSGSTSNLKLGETDATDAPQPQFGMYDEVKIYTSALTADQVKAEFNQGSAAVWGATSTDSSGNPSWSAANEYCPPGQGSTCTPPVAEWKLDDKTGTTTSDSSGNGGTGTFYEGTTPNSNGPTWSAGKFGPGVNFPGTDDVIRIPESTVTDLGTTTDSYTVSAWFKTSTNSSTTAAIVNKECGASSSPFRLSLDSSELPLFNVRESVNTTSTVGTTALNDNLWHFITGVRDVATDTVKLYVDGVLIDTETDITTVTTVNDCDISIGNGAGTSYNSNDFNGPIDNVRIYNYARTPAQVAWEYNRGAPVAYWNFDECANATAYDTAPKADPRATGLNGTITPGGVPNSAVGTCTSGDSAHMWYDGASGKRNASLGFDGTDDYVTVSDPGTGSALDFDTGQSITLSAWVKSASLPSSGTYQNIIAKGATDGTNDANYFLQYGNRGGNYVLDLCYAESGTGTWNCTESNLINLTVGTWQHFVITHTFGTASAVKKYQNGILLPQGSWTSSSGTAAPSVTNKTFWIGANNTAGGGATDEEMNGLIDEVKIWNYILTPQQIRDDYNQGALRFGN